MNYLAAFVLAVALLGSPAMAQKPQHPRPVPTPHPMPRPVPNNNWHRHAPPYHPGWGHGRPYLGYRFPYAVPIYPTPAYPVYPIPTAPPGYYIDSQGRTVPNGYFYDMFGRLVPMVSYSY